MTTTILSLAPRLLSRLARPLAPAVHMRILPAPRSFFSSVGLGVGAKRAATTQPASTKLTPKLKPKSKPKSVRKPTKAKAKSKAGKKPAKSGRPKVAKPKVRLTRDLKPPRAPPNAFILFFQQQLAARHPASLADTADIARDSAARWHDMPSAEQQPFRSAHTAARTQYVEQRAAYWAGVDRNVVRALNAQRRAQGKPRLRGPRNMAPKPVTGFLRFMHVFRESPKGRALVAEGPRDGRNVTVRMCVAGGEAWRLLSNEEKDSYNREWAKETEEWKKKKQAEGGT